MSNPHDCPGGDGGDPDALREIANVLWKNGALWYVYECQHGHSHLGGAA